MFEKIQYQLLRIRPMYATFIASIDPLLMFLQVAGGSFTRRYTSVADQVESRSRFDPEKGQGRVWEFHNQRLITKHCVIFMAELPSQVSLRMQDSDWILSHVVCNEVTSNGKK